MSKATTVNLNNPDDKKKLFDDVARLPQKGSVLETNLASTAEAPLLRALGFPTEEVISVTCHGSIEGKQYNDFIVELMGVLERDIPEGGARSPTSITIYRSLNDKPEELNVWRKRVFERNAHIIIREIYNPSTDLYSPISLALGGIGWVSSITHVRTIDNDLIKEVADAQRVALGFLLLRDVAKRARLVPPRSKGFEWTDDACLRLRNEYHSVTSPALTTAEKIIKALIDKQMDSRQSILAACRSFADVELIIALHTKLTTRRGRSASDLALEQAARNIGVDKNLFQISSLRTYLTRGNNLANRA
ncbi:MAG: hypothetical protein WBV94_14845 [Blastocatellia bacterium]